MAERERPALRAVPFGYQVATQEYLDWLRLEANRSPNTVRAYASDLRKLEGFLRGQGHSLELRDLVHEDLRGFQRFLAETLPSPRSRHRALAAVRSWLGWLDREQLLGEAQRSLAGRITLPKVPDRLPRPMPPEELARLLSGLPSGSPLEKRDRALVQFLISTGCRISEALGLDRTDVPRRGSRLTVMGKGSKQRTVYLTEAARAALDDYLGSRLDASLALFVNYDPVERAGGQRRLSANGARHIVRKLQRELGVWTFRSPHVARHTAATSLLEVTGGDVRLVQEVLGHANLATLQGYTRIVDGRKVEAYRLYGAFLERTQREEGRP